MNKSLKSILLIVALGIIAIVVVVLSKPRPAFGNLDGFAKCLATQGAIMYGANWCPHCQKEKKTFGKTFRFVNYIECPENPQKCLANKIDGYPTWVFPDGRRLIGEQGIENLARESGCPIYNKP